MHDHCPKLLPTEYLHTLQEIYDTRDGERLLAWKHFKEFVRYLLDHVNQEFKTQQDVDKLAGRFSFYYQTVGQTEYTGLMIDDEYTSYSLLVRAYLQAKINYDKKKAEESYAEMRLSDVGIVYAESHAELVEVVEPGVQYGVAGLPVCVDDYLHSYRQKPLLSEEMAQFIAYALVRYYADPEREGAEAQVREAIASTGFYCYLQALPVTEWLNMLVKNNFTPVLPGSDLLVMLSRVTAAGPVFILKDAVHGNAHFLYDASAVHVAKTGRAYLQMSQDRLLLHRHLLYALVNDHFSPMVRGSYLLAGAAPYEIRKPYSFLVLFHPVWWSDLLDACAARQLTLRGLLAMGIPPIYDAHVTYNIIPLAVGKSIEFSTVKKYSDGWEQLTVAKPQWPLKPMHESCKVCPRLSVSSCYLCDGVDYILL